jgi:squalene-hopene/tetraprenyl-beta-curcumene cyclase
MERNDRIKRRQELAARLLDQRNENGIWEGRLSSSALGVAVSVTALRFAGPVKHKKPVDAGIRWLVANQNSDGGFGDTAESISNISTSSLVYAALNLADKDDPDVVVALEKLAGYLNNAGIDIHSPSVAEAILAHYKTDYTFSVPILVMCALCGIPGKDAFRKIPQLPFELALLPRSFYSMLKLNVVSYAIPALIAVGMAIHHFKSRKNPVLRGLRNWAVKPALRLLHRLMPESGGFLEAMPLTGFVSMCLIASGHSENEVVKKGIGFLLRTQREDGSWPIDVDLSTWVTTLSVKALRSPPAEVWRPEERHKITRHLLEQQTKTIHPFNGAKPGGWGWTSHSGSVPDGDDTPGAIIALIALNREEPLVVRDAVVAGCNWLLNLQNSDGGFPTFVRGWGKLPFDQSCADLTGHSVLALGLTLSTFRDKLSPVIIRKYERSLNRGISWLAGQQRSDGSLLPLWFGNQQAESHLDPVYGTARVLTYLNDLTALPRFPEPVRNRVVGIVIRGREYLRSSQNEDGSWGGDAGVPGTIEETALALGALAGKEDYHRCEKAVAWLEDYHARHGMKSAPIGLYFASLWYDEKLYPHTAYLEGLSRFLDQTA